MYGGQPTSHADRVIAPDVQPTVLLWVESPHGTGHIGITRRLADKLIARGCRVVIASHDLFAKQHPFLFRDCETIKLPPYQAQDNMLDLSQRREELLNVLQSSSPNAIITEMWPMGRHEFDGEMTAFVERAKSLGIPNYAVVRPYVAEREGQRQDSETADIIARNYKHVFIRSDQQAIPMLQAGRPEFNGRLKDILVYSGFLAASGSPTDKSQILFSFGGGWNNEKEALLTGVLNAAQMFAEHPERWPHLQGLRWMVKIPDAASDPEYAWAQDQVSELRVKNGVDIAIGRYGSDFQDQLAKSKLSVGFAGQTAMEALIQKSVPVITVMQQPNGDDVGEQDYVSKCLVGNKLAVAFDESCLRDPKCLLDKMEEGAQLDLLQKDIICGGADRIADIITQSLKVRSRVAS